MHGPICWLPSSFCGIALLIAATTTTTLAAPPTASARTAPSTPMGKSDVAHDLPNFQNVAPGIYRGAAPTAAGLAHLKSIGVRTIIDLRIEKKGQAEEAKTAKELGMDRIRIPLGREAPTKKQVATFLATVNNPAAQPVFIHCQYGADRTGAMVGIYRVTHEGWSFDRAYGEMRRYGFKPYLGELKGAVRERAAK